VVYLPILQTLILLADDLALAALLLCKKGQRSRNSDGQQQPDISGFIKIPAIAGRWFAKPHPRWKQISERTLVDDDYFTHEMMGLFLRNTDSFQHARESEQGEAVDRTPHRDRRRCEAYCSASDQI